MTPLELIQWGVAALIVFIVGALIGVILYAIGKTVKDARQSRRAFNRQIDTKSDEGEYNA